jgi:hypothetical protein
VSDCCNGCRRSRPAVGPRWCSMSRLGRRRPLTADVATPPPSPHSGCWEGGGFRPCADDAPTHPRSDCWHVAELFACCAATASTNAFSCWHTHRSSKVAASGQPRSSIATAARFCDARRKSSGASTSVLASMYAPLLAHQLLSCAGPRTNGVGTRACS